MKSSSFLAVIVIGIILVGCQKPVIEPNGLVSSWEIYQVDSCWTGNSFGDSIFHTVAEIPASGFIYFYEDSTCLFEMEPRYSCGRPIYPWSINPTNDSITFFYSIYWERSLIKVLNPEILEFYRSTCTPSPGLGTTTYYLFKGRRIENQ